MPVIGPDTVYQVFPLDHVADGGRESRRLRYRAIRGDLPSIDVDPVSSSVGDSQACEDDFVHSPILDSVTRTICFSAAFARTRLRSIAVNAH